MSKEVVAIVSLGLTLIAASAGFGMQIGRLTERVEAQRASIDGLTAQIKALNEDFNGTRLEMMRLLGSHIDSPQPRRTR